MGLAIVLAGTNIALIGIRRELGKIRRAIEALKQSSGHCAKGDGDGADSTSGVT